MATEIVAVDTEWVPTPGTNTEHFHVVRVQTADGRVLSRATVISRIEGGIEEFYTAGGGEEAKVVVVPCPRCFADGYIRTTADETIADNLDVLPAIEGCEPGRPATPK
jgi:hypothetical protein